MSDSTKADVKAVFERILAALNSGDAEELRSLIMPGPDGTHIGTDAAEWWSTDEFLQNVTEANAQHDVTAEADEVGIHVRGDVAWLDGMGRFKNSRSGERAVRFTGVFVRDNGKWQCAQSHASIGVPNDQIFSS